MSYRSEMRARVLGESAQQILGGSIRVGDHVHAGLAQKGGAGFKGVVDRVEGNFVYVNIGTDKFGDRIIKAPLKTVMKEAALHEGKDFAIVVVDPDGGSPSWKRGGQGHTAVPKVVWQMHSLASHELKDAVELAREKHPKLNVSIENKSGRIVRVLKPGEKLPSKLTEGEQISCPSCHRKVDKNAGWCRHCKQDITEGTDDDSIRRKASIHWSRETRYYEPGPYNNGFLAAQRGEKHPPLGSAAFQAGFDAGKKTVKEAYSRNHDGEWHVLCKKCKHEWYQASGPTTCPKCKAERRYLEKTGSDTVNEAPSLFGKNGAWGPAVGKAVSKWGNSRFTEAELEKVWKVANKYPNDAKREYALRCVDELKGLGRAKFKDADSLLSVKIPSGLAPMVAKGIRNNIEDALNESTDAVGKAVSAFGKNLAAQSRYTEKQCQFLSKWANSYQNGPKREYALQIFDYMRNLGPKAWREKEDVITAVKIPAGLTDTFAASIRLDARYAAKDCLTESSNGAMGKPKAPSETDRLKVSQAQELIAVKMRQSQATMAAQLRDVANKSREQQVKLNAPKGTAHSS